MTNQIIVALVGGFAAWAAIQGVTYLVLRNRLVVYLVVQINARLQAAHGNREWLDQLARDHSSAGIIPTVAPRYSPDHAEDLHESRELILKYLSRNQIERVTKFLSYLWEVEYLTEGVCEAIGAYSRRKTPLDAEDCRYLRDKVTRVTSIIGKWPATIKGLDDLPIDYAGVWGPGAVKVTPKGAGSQRAGVG